jgi:hypothetical protein
MNTNESGAEPGSGASKIKNSSDCPNSEFIDDFETVLLRPGFDPDGDMVVLDSLGHPRSVRKPR